MDGEISDIHNFWFGELDDRGMASPEHRRLWFTASAEFDQTLAGRFGRRVEQALSGALAGWAERDDGLVALVLLLDQFPRNIFRGTPRAFAGDPRALALARMATDSGRHRALPLIHRVFLYLPLEHSENLAAQDECLRLFSELEGDTGYAEVADFARYARAHRDIIARFGRFPHRNAILGRPSTSGELEHLAQHGGF
jgi:uncharacterized protein (DUF924 family)